MKRILTGIFAFVLAGLLPAAAAMADHNVKIGWIGPLSGWGTFGGTAIMRGSSLAIDHINAAGGVNGHKLELEDETGTLVATELGPGASARIPPGRRHRFTALEDCELVEVSTPELDDVVRIDDDYGRAP